MSTPTTDQPAAKRPDSADTRPYTLDDFYQEGLRIRQGPYVMGAMTEFNMLWYRLPFLRTIGVHHQDAAVAFCKGYDDGYPPVPKGAGS